MADMERFLPRAYDGDTPEEVRDFYDRWANTYDQELEDNDYVGPARVVAALIEHCGDRASTILDVGCGTGLAGEALRTYGYNHVDGLDLSPTMLEKAEGKGVYRTLLCGDLTKGIELPDSAYDAALSVGTFTFAHVGPEALDEVLRLVRSGGVLCVGINRDAYLEHRYEDAFENLSRRGMCRVLSNREEDYIRAEGVRGRIVVLERT